MREERKKVEKKVKKKKMKAVTAVAVGDATLTEEAVVVVETTAVLTETKEAKVSCVTISWLSVLIHSKALPIT